MHNHHIHHSHLINCLEKQEFTMFPIKKERCQARKIKSSETIPLYCIRRISPIKELPMIQCSQCKQWYHGKNCIKTEEAWLTELLPKRMSQTVNCMRFN